MNYVYKLYEWMITILGTIFLAIFGFYDWAKYQIVSCRICQGTGYDLKNVVVNIAIKPNDCPSCKGSGKRL